MAAAFIQEADTFHGSPSQTITVTITVTAGSSLLVFGLTSAAPTCADGVNGSYGTAAESVVDNIGLFNTAFCKDACASGSTTITIDSGGGGNAYGIWVIEIGGTPGLNGHAAHADSSAPGAGTDAVSSGNGTPGAQPGLMVGFTAAFFYGAGSPVAGTGFTSGALGWNGGGSSLGRSERKAYAALTAVPATFTAGVGGSGDIFSTFVAFFPDSGGGGGTDQPRPRRPRIEELPEETLLRRRFAPIIPASVVNSPPPRARQRVLDVAEDERRDRRRQVAPPTAVVTAQPARIARRGPDDAPEDIRPRRHSDAIAALDVPVTVPDLALWLRGDGSNVSGGNAVSVNDWSGVGNDVATVGTIPFLASSINGKPGWQFTGGGYLANLVNNLFTPGGARTIFLVVKSATEAGGPLLENQRTSGVRATYFQGGSAYSFAAGVYTNSIDGTRNATIAPGGIAGVPMIVEFTAAAAPAYLTMRINGVPQAITQVNPCDTETGVAGFLVGYWFAGGSAYIGEMDEAIAYRRVLSAAEQLTIRTYLALRYLIGVDMPTWRSRQWMDAVRASWDVEDIRARRVRLPPQPTVTPDNPPPRARPRIVELAEEERAARRSRMPIADDGPPPWSRRRREEEPESIVGRIVRKLVPPPAAIVDNPPPRAGRSNWRVVWESFEPVELLRKVYKLVFPGAPGPINNQVVRPPLRAVVDALDQTVSAPGVTQVAVFDARDMTVTPDT